MKNSLRYAAERRRTGIERSASVATGIFAAGGAGAIAVAVGLAVSTPATAGSGTGTGTSQGTVTNPSDNGTSVQQPSQGEGGLAPGGNSPPQSQSHGS